MKNIISKMDQLLRNYLGIDQSEIRPETVRKSGNGLVILNTESFKRHVNEMPISDISLDSMNQDNKKKLGLAIGKAIAKNLTVSFEEISINRDNVNAR